MIWPTDYLNKVICGDCLEVMKGIPDKSVDLVLTDPPYGIGLEYDTITDGADELRKIIPIFMRELLRIGNIVIITCGVANIYLYPKPDWILAWVSSAGVGSGPWGFCCWQPILVYGKDPYLTNGKGRRPDIFESNERSEKNGHPCPKPIKLWKQILMRASINESDVILDPFFGSGTTGVAAKLLSRQFIGIEISEKYCEIARKRIDGTLVNRKLQFEAKP